jgi:hypothetical protein
MFFGGWEFPNFLINFYNYYYSGLMVFY